NSIILHPLMILILHDAKSMSWEIRLGYFLIEIFLILFDWIFNFALRPYFLAPYSGLFCGGPICRMITSRAAIMLKIALSTVITAHVPCVWFLFMRIHRQVTAGTGSLLLL
ncbi:hypothetical protein PMAYCL1PPCAC_16633, partial [Pristionchus mayeri]